MYGQPYYQNPAMQTAQQRLQMMEAQYPQFAGTPGSGYMQPNGYAPQPQQAAPTATILKGRPVSNKDEANAAMIDYDGSLFVFPDKAHGKIYTKQLGLDGNILFLEYTLDMGNQPQPVQQEAQIVAPPIDFGEYVKRDDLEQKLSEIQNKLSKLEQRLPGINKGGNKQ
jgi:hypothetical protein